MTQNSLPTCHSTTEASHLNKLFSSLYFPFPWGKNIFLNVLTTVGIHSSRRKQSSESSRRADVVTSAIFHFRHLFHRVTANSMNTSCWTPSLCARITSHVLFMSLLVNGLMSLSPFDNWGNERLSAWPLAATEIRVSLECPGQMWGSFSLFLKAKLLRQ